MIDDDADDLIVTSPLFGDTESVGLALQKGKLVHRMLQMLTEFAETERGGGGKALCGTGGAFLAGPERQKLVAAVMSVAVPSGPGGGVFGPQPVGSVDHGNTGA